MTAEEEQIILKELRPFMNSAMQLTAYPVKNHKKLIMLWYFRHQLYERAYPEREINALLNGWALFHEPATLRREMYNKFPLDREDDGSSYRVVADIPPLAEFIAKYV